MLIHVLSRVIIRDESWVYKYDIKKKRASLVCDRHLRNHGSKKHGPASQMWRWWWFCFSIAGEFRFKNQFHVGRLFSAGANVGTSGAHASGPVIYNGNAMYKIWLKASHIWFAPSSKKPCNNCTRTSPRPIFTRLIGWKSPWRGPCVFEIAGLSRIDIDDRRTSWSTLWFGFDFIG